MDKNAGNEVAGDVKALDCSHWPVDFGRALNRAKMRGFRRGWSIGISLMPTALPLYARLETDAVRKAWMTVGECLYSATEKPKVADTVAGRTGAAEPSVVEAKVSGNYALHTE